MATERDDRIKALREELKQARSQLESEKKEKTIDNIVALEQQRESTRHSHNDIMSQLRDVASILEEHTTAQSRDRKQMQKMQDDKDERRREMDAKFHKLHNTITQ